MTAILAREALEGKTVLVTGASSGIGRATASLAASCGARIIVSGRSEERVQQTLGSLDGTGHVAHTFAMTNPDDMTAEIQALAKSHGRLDGVFHAAGVGLVRPIKLTKQQHIDEVFAASFGAALAIARAAAMRDVVADSGASLVFMSSVAAQRGQPGMSVYSASKGAVDAAVRSLACELAPRNVRVNGLAAGAVETEMHQRTVDTMPSESIKDYENKHLLGFGVPLDIAQVAVFLLSDASRWITGAIWTVDGGYLAK